MLEKVGFESIITDADIIFSGEGSVDSQTSYGKVISGIGGYAKKHKKPLIVVAGQLSDGYENIYESGVTAAFGTVSKVQTFEEIKKNAEENLYKTVANIARLLNINNNM